MDAKKLLELKEDIADAKVEISELTGMKKGLMEQLKNDHNCTSLEAAERKLKVMAEDREKLQKKIEEETKTLETLYNEQD